MDLVDEQDGVATVLVEILLRLLHRSADVLDAGKHRRQRNEFTVEGIGHEPRQRGLADAGRSPQDHRMDLAGLEGQSQRLARAEQMALADHLAQLLRP